MAWIGQLSTEGRWIVISGDRRITRNKVEYAAFRSSRLVGFFLSKGLYKAPVVKQMERLLALWSTIEKQSEIVAGGAMFELPIKSTRIEQLKVWSKGCRYTFAFRQPAHHASHCEQNQRSPRAGLTRVAK
ncbi:hypothetical protein NKI09_23565 [Mesorhizobium sp. M0757]|uniref:PIN-like domain-containing protein n=1 Tax=Mesorhizobium sp. M0757 TaxID=2956993 RepID=UPI003334E91E